MSGVEKPAEPNLIGSELAHDLVDVTALAHSDRICVGRALELLVVFAVEQLIDATNSEGSEVSPELTPASGISCTQFIRVPSRSAS